ncbi:MAG: hypothetical protein ACFBRM_00115 [Pikeienuella sp.]
MTQILSTLTARLIAWLEARRTVDFLAAKTPDQREDLGLTISDMRILGA